MQRADRRRIVQFVALVAMLWECCEDMKEAASSGKGGESDEDER